MKTNLLLENIDIQWIFRLWIMIIFGYLSIFVHYVHCVNHYYILKKLIFIIKYYFMISQYLILNNEKHI